MTFPGWVLNGNFWHISSTLHTAKSVFIHSSLMCSWVPVTNPRLLECAEAHDDDGGGPVSWMGIHCCYRLNIVAAAYGVWFLEEEKYRWGFIQWILFIFKKLSAMWTGKGRERIITDNNPDSEVTKRRQKLHLYGFEYLEDEKHAKTKPHIHPRPRML